MDRRRWRMVNVEVIRTLYALMQVICNGKNSPAHTEAMHTSSLLKELLHRSGETAASIARKLANHGVQQPQMSRFINEKTREPKRSTMAPIAEFYGVPVDAFYEEEIAELLLADIASGAFVVKANRRGIAWAPPQSGMAVIDPTGVTAATTLPQALDVLTASIKALPMSARKLLSEDLALLAIAPGDPETRQRVLDHLSSAGQSELMGDGVPKQTPISLRNQEQNQKAA